MQLFSVAIRWSNKMNFSLYANMAGFSSDNYKYKIHLDGFTNEYVKHLCTLYIVIQQLQCFFIDYVLCTAALILLSQGCCVIDFHAKIRILLKDLNCSSKGNLLYMSVVCEM